MMKIFRYFISDQDFKYLAKNGLSFYAETCFQLGIKTIDDFNKTFPAYYYIFLYEAHNILKTNSELFWRIYDYYKEDDRVYEVKNHSDFLDKLQQNKILSEEEFNYLSSFRFFIIYKNQ